MFSINSYLGPTNTNSKTVVERISNIHKGHPSKLIIYGIHNTENVNIAPFLLYKCDSIVNNGIQTFKHTKIASFTTIGPYNIVIDGICGLTKGYHAYTHVIHISTEDTTALTQTLLLSMDRAHHFQTPNVTYDHADNSSSTSVN